MSGHSESPPSQAHAFQLPETSEMQCNSQVTPLICVSQSSTGTCVLHGVENIPVLQASSLTEAAMLSPRYQDNVTSPM